MQSSPDTDLVIEGVRKIAVVRANSLGDHLFAYPALDAIHAAYPSAEIVLLGKHWHRDFLSNRPGPIDRVAVVPVCDGMPHESDRTRDAAEVERFFRTMHAERFDIALQMHGGGGNSNPFTKRLGARLCAGFQAPGAPPLDITVPYYLQQNEVLRYLELASYIGARTQFLEPKVHVTAADEQEAEQVTGGLKKPFAVLHPGAAEVQRRWDAANFSKVGKALLEHGLKVYVTGIGPECDTVRKVVRGMDCNAMALCDVLSLNGLTGLLSQARLMVSNDTGPLHLARAVGTPTVGIYWCGNIVTAGIITARKNRMSISWRMQCPLCGVDCMKVNVHHPHDGCDHKVSFLDDISAHEITEHAVSLLDQTS